jgi:transposase
MDGEQLVTVGVDTHTDVHVPAVLDQAGRLLGTASFPATTRGYARLATWAESFGQVDKVGMEGTGSFGAGLLRFLADYGLTVIEVDRPDRSARRRSAQIDAIIVSAPEPVRGPPWPPLDVVMRRPDGP